MTREEAINLIDINRCNLKATNEEGFSKDIEALDKAILALEQENVLDKIRAEIEFEVDHRTNMLCAEDVFNIIDKYRGESAYDVAQENVKNGEIVDL